jgi:hypothetical protein
VQLQIDEKTPEALGAVALYLGVMWKYLHQNLLNRYRAQSPSNRDVHA